MPPAFQFDSFQGNTFDTGPATLFPTGIPSAEAFGAVTRILGGIIVPPGGIASAEAFGTPAISVGPIAVVPTGIASAGAFGTPAVALGPITVSPTGIATAEAFGTPAVVGANVLIPTGIASGETFGTPAVALGPITVAPTGIASGEALGTPVAVLGPITASPTGIPSAEALGAPTAILGPITVAPTGIASAEAFGTPARVLGPITVGFAGIPSAEAFGTPSVSYGPLTVTPTGIASGEAFGTTSVTVSSPGGLTVFPVGIGLPTGVAFQSDSFQGGTFDTVTTSLVGLPTVILGGPVVAPTGIASREAFGTPTVVVNVTPPRTVFPTGIGLPVSPAFTAAFQIDTFDQAASSQFGLPTVITHGFVVYPLSIDSEEAFGRPTVRGPMYMGDVHIVWDKPRYKTLAWDVAVSLVLTSDQSLGATPLGPAFQFDAFLPTAFDQTARSGSDEPNLTVKEVTVLVWDTLAEIAEVEREPTIIVWDREAGATPAGPAFQTDAFLTTAFDQTSRAFSTVPILTEWTPRVIVWDALAEIEMEEKPPPIRSWDQPAKRLVLTGHGDTMPP